MAALRLSHPDGAAPGSVGAVPRVRLGVALLVPEPTATEIDGLRRAAGDGALDRVAPHLTLVPPVNVRVEDLPAALAVLRSAASAAAPLTLRLGPPVTFLPETPTLHLAVGGSGTATARLRQLRDAVFVPPLERPLTHSFVPHVTLADDMDPDRIPAAVAALADYVVDVDLDRVHLLHEQRHGDAHRRWVPVADVPFGRPAVVGRGGFELELTVSRLLDPEAAAFESGSWPDDVPRQPPPGPVPGAEPVVVVARHRGAVVGLARGWYRPDHVELTSVLVAPDRRGHGVARHLLTAFHHAAG